jgi:hypothetical protein
MNQQRMKKTGFARDFRSFYYFQLGFQGVNIKTLENLMKENMIDMQRLKEFCLKCQISNQLRFKIWKILIGVLPTARKSWNYVSQQYYEQFEDIFSTMLVIQPDLFNNIENQNQNESDTSSSTSSSSSSTGSSSTTSIIDKHEQLFVLYKLHKVMFNEIREKNPVKSEHQSLLSAQEEKYHILQIIRVFSNACDNQQPPKKKEANYEMRMLSDTYWCFSLFVERYFGWNFANWRDSVFWLTGELTKQIEQVDKKFYNLMMKRQPEVDKIFAAWFTSMFSSFLSMHKTMRLWDCLLLFPVEFISNNIALSYVKRISSKIFMNDNEVTDLSQLTFHLIQIEEYDIEAIIQSALEMTKK